MTDIVLNPVLNMGNFSSLNDNFDKIEASLNEDVIKKSGGSNIMSQDLDLNSFNLLNVRTDFNDPTSLTTVADALDHFYSKGQIPNPVNASDAVNLSTLNTNIASVNAEINVVSAAQQGGMIGYATKALMDADLSRPINTIGQVTNDATSGNNVNYRFDGSVWVASVDRLASALGNGSGFQQEGDGAVVLSYQKKGRQEINVLDYGAIGDGVTSDAYAFQRAMNAAHARGGAKVIIPPPSVAWLLDYPVFIRDNTEVAGTGAGCKIIVKNPSTSKGRGGFVIGSSREANRDLALAAYVAGTFPGATTNSSTFTNPTLKQYLRDNLSFVQAKNSCIHDIYLVAQWDNPANSGGYGINIVNALNCHAYNIWGEGWTQLIGMGSDVAPETPSNHLCTATHLQVVKPDPVATYYAVGFIANSTSCRIQDATVYAPVTVGTANGSGVALNYTEGCSVFDVHIPNLGRSTTSQGVLVDNSKGARIDRVYVGNAKQAVSTFYNDSTFNDVLNPNIIGPSITGYNCDSVIQLGAKYASVLGIKNIGSTYDLSLQNLNATNNTVGGVLSKISTAADQTRLWYFQNNTIEGWASKKMYLRPASLLVNPKSDITSWDTNKSVVTGAAGTKLSFLWMVPPGIKAIELVRCFMTYAGNAQAAGSQLSVSVRRMIAYDGNTGTAPYVEGNVTDVASNTATSNKQIQLNSLFVETADTTHGLQNSVDVLIEFILPTANSVMKEIFIQYYG